MRAVQDGEGLQVPQLPALLQRAQEPRAARDARVRPRPAVPLSLLRLLQAPPQRAQEARREEAPGPAPAEPRARHPRPLARARRAAAALAPRRRSPSAAPVLYTSALFLDKPLDLPSR